MRKVLFTSVFFTLVSFLLLFLFSGVSVAAGNTYYLDCSGSDGNTGTSEIAAWQSLSKASSFTFQPGDKLLLKKACTWNGTLTVSESGNTTSNIFVGAYGTGELPIVQTGTNNTSSINLGGSYITLDSIFTKAIAPSTDSSCQNNPVGHIVGVTFETGAANNTVQNSKLTGGYAGVYIKSGSTNNHILNNNIYQNIMMSPLDTAGGNDAGAFGVLLWGDDNEIAYNQISGNDACSYDYVRDGASVEVYGGQRNNIHHNVSWDSDAFSELGNSRSADNIYAYNLFRSSLTRSIFLNTRGSGNYGPVNGTVLYNNTVYLTGTSSQGFVCSGCSPAILKMRNNIIQAAGKVGYADSAFDTANNIYFQGQRQFSLGANDLTVDPLFVNASVSDFHLKTGSPAIDSGSSDTLTGGYTTDLDKFPIPFGSGLDRGAYEFGSGGGTPPSPTPTPQFGTGDANRDGRVDFADIVFEVNNWFNPLTNDVDQFRDGEVNSMDLAVTISRIPRSTTAPTVTPSPTPTGTASTPTPTATPQVPTPTPPVIGGSFTVAAVGDINGDNNTSTTSNSGKNAASITQENPSFILGLGDYQYQSGTCSKFVSGFDRLWSGLVSRMYTTAGPTHDWNATNSDGQQYQTYFGGLCSGQIATQALSVSKDPSQPYSFDIGKWHFVQLSSGCSRYTGVCSVAGESSWLAADLANAVATGHPYIVAFWHEPYFTSTSTSHGPLTSLRPWIDLLYQYRARIILNGHQHGYERFLPQTNTSAYNADGVQSFIVGTGGIGFYQWTNVAPNSATQQANTYGWLKLTFREDGGYDWQFVPTANGTYTDSGTRPAAGF